MAGDPLDNKRGGETRWGIDIAKGGRRPGGGSIRQQRGYEDQVGAKTEILHEPCFDMAGWRAKPKYFINEPCFGINSIVLVDMQGLEAFFTQCGLQIPVRTVDAPGGGDHHIHSLDTANEGLQHYDPVAEKKAMEATVKACVTVGVAVKTTMEELRDKDYPDGESQICVQVCRLLSSVSHVGWQSMRHTCMASAVWC